MEIDNKLKQRRKQQGFSVRGLSVAAGISTATIVAIERYGDFPSAKTRAKLGRALNMDESMIWPHLQTPLEVSDDK